MIKRLSIRNYAIIEELEVQFPKGLTIITGETGAGKSILLGALGLIMGERADSKSLFDESKKCVIEATFDVKAYGLKPFFEENDLDYFDECIIRRELSPSGKSRAFVNDTPVTLDILRRLAGALVDLHQQFDTLDIHNVSFQLRMIDALAGNRELLANYSAVYRDFVKTRRKLEELKRLNQQSAQESEFLQFQLDEFEKAALVSGEQDELEAELRRLNHAEDIKRTLSAAWQLIAEGENPVSGQLREMLRSLSEIKKFSPDAAGLYDRLDSAILELDDIGAECERLAEATEFDPERIVEIQQRLDVIYRLQNKHRVATVEELLQIQQDLQQRFEALGDLSAEIGKFEKQLDELALRL
ncbi:MAG: DNA repair protein RecN, partial [Bacteroidetes bacterium]